MGKHDQIAGMAELDSIWSAEQVLSVVDHDCRTGSMSRLHNIQTAFFYSQNCSPSLDRPMHI